MNSTQWLNSIHFTMRHVSAKRPLAPHFLVLTLLCSSFWIIIHMFWRNNEAFYCKISSFSIYERTPFLPRCAFEMRKGVSALMRLLHENANRNIHWNTINGLVIMMCHSCYNEFNISFNDAIMFCTLVTLTLTHSKSDVVHDNNENSCNFFIKDTLLKPKRH